MINFVKKHWDLVLVNLITIIFFFGLQFLIGIDVSEKLMYSTVDGNSYLEVSHWIETGENTPYIGVRPFLYPLLISIANFIGGFIGIWILQIIFWVLSVNFLYLSIIRFTSQKILGFIGVLMFISNLSLISLTWHALSEITTTFLLSVFVLHVAMNKSNLTSIRCLHGTVLILALLTVVRPMFLLPLFGLLALILIIKFKTYFKTPLKLLWVGLVLLPVFIQMGVLKWNYDEWGISMRSSETVDFYLMAQCMQQDKHIELAVAREIITEMPIVERRNYQKNNIGLMGSNLMKNVKENIEGDSYMLIHRPKFENTELRTFMINTNKRYYQIHKLFIVILLIYSFFLIWKKDWAELLLIWALIIIPLYYLIASGVSFWQGDRLVVPAITGWLALYLLVLDRLSRCVSFIFKRMRTNE